MNRVIIKTTPESKYLRIKAMEFANLVEEKYLSIIDERKGIIWAKRSEKGELLWIMLAVKTKKSIIVSVKLS